MSDETKAIAVDSIQSIGVHNGIARVLFVRLSAEGKPQPAIELLIPVNQIATIAQGLAKVR